MLDLPLRLGGLRDARWITVIIGPVLYDLIGLLVPLTYRALALDTEADRRIE